MKNTRGVLGTCLLDSTEVQVDKPVTVTMGLCISIKVHVDSNWNNDNYYTCRYKLLHSGSCLVLFRYYIKFESRDFNFVEFVRK